MIQRFIEIGEGYSDIYELIELAKSNCHRLHNLLILNTVKNNKPVSSLVVSLHPAVEGNFQPLYICREGIPNPQITDNKRYQLFKLLAEDLNKRIISIDLKSSIEFAEKELFYQYVIGILRVNHILAPLK
jgi:hypothetical protein